MNRTLSMLVHGESGVGKSRLGDTAPAPRLILDAEGRAQYLPSEPKVSWDPTQGGPPEVGDWQTCVTYVHNFDVLNQVFQWLQSGQHPFKSVVVDSLMEIQKRLIDNIVGLDQLNQQDWGVLLRRLEAMVRSYRDLLLQPSNPTELVFFTVGSQDIEGVKRPLLQGQLRMVVPYYLDTVGYMFVQHDNGGPPTRKLLVQPTTTIVAKDGTGLLGGPIIDNPDLSEMFTQLNGGA